MYENGNPDLSALEMEGHRNPLYKHVAKTYGWMFLGLILTFSVAFGMMATGAVFFLYAIWWLPFALLIGKLALVVYLTSRLHNFRVGTARIIFLLYSVLTGVVFSSILLLYEAEAAILAFGVSAVFFGIMAGAGLITKRDVSGFAPIITVGLVSLLIMGLVSMFFQLPGLDTAYCFIGLFIFLGVTTYDAKKTKDLYYHYEQDPEMLEKISIYSALNLYLDFINIFLFLLRLLGKKR